MRAFGRAGRNGRNPSRRRTAASRPPDRLLGQGTGADTRILVVLHRRANARMASKVERFDWQALHSGNQLFMSVTPVYGDPRSAVRTSVQVGMTVYNGDGQIKDSFSCTAVKSKTGFGSTC